MYGCPSPPLPGGIGGAGSRFGPGAGVGYQGTNRPPPSMPGPNGFYSLLAPRDPQRNITHIGNDRVYRDELGNITHIGNELVYRDELGNITHIGDRKVYP